MIYELGLPVSTNGGIKFWQIWPSRKRLWTKSSIFKFESLCDDLARRVQRRMHICKLHAYNLLVVSPFSNKASKSIVFDLVQFVCLSLQFVVWIAPSVRKEKYKKKIFFRLHCALKARCRGNSTFAQCLESAQLHVYTCICDICCRCVAAMDTHRQQPLCVHWNK